MGHVAEALGVAFEAVVQDADHGRGDGVVAAPLDAQAAAELVV